jgi:hypothetical protein
MTAIDSPFDGFANARCKNDKDDIFSSARFFVRWIPAFAGMTRG